MSYNELEQGYLGLTSQPLFYIGDDCSGYINWNKIEKDTEHVDSEDESLGEGKQVLVGICAMSKKSQSKPMKEILTRLEEFEYIRTVVFPEEVILNQPVEEWPLCDCLVSFHSKGFPLNKAIEYAELRNPFTVNDLFMQYDIQDRRKVYSMLEDAGIELPRYAVLDRESTDEKQRELVEGEDHVEVNGVTFNKPFVEKPISAEDHNIYIYYPTSAGGGSQRLFRKIGSRSSVYSPESRVRKTGSFIYEEFMPTDGTDVKVYTVGPDYAHAEARKSPALDGKVERDKEGKEVRYPVILTNTEKMIARKVCLAFKQTVCGFDLLRANGKSYVCDVNGFSFVKNSMKYYDDCAKILGNMILRELAPQLHIPWSMPFQLDDPPIVPTTFGKMMELRCVIAVIRHGDRTPKQKMKMEVKHPKFFELFEHYGGFKDGCIKLKKPKQLQEILDISRFLLSEIEHKSDPEVEENKAKLEQLKSVLEMYGHFSGINRKVQLKYQPKGRPRHSSSDEDYPREPSLVLILKWGGELTPAGRVQAEELGRVFRCMYPGGQVIEKHDTHLLNQDVECHQPFSTTSIEELSEYAGTRGLGLLRLHSTFRHDLKIYASDEGRVQMTAAAFAKGLLALEGELTPILVQMVKSANTNGLLDNDCDSSKYQNINYRVKQRLHEAFQVDHDFTEEDFEKLNPTRARSIQNALQFIKNPVKACQHVYEIIQELIKLIKFRKDESKSQGPLYHGETWELMQRRWAKLEKDFQLKSGKFDISKIPDVYDCIKYDLQHNQHTLQFPHAQELYLYAKALADVVIPQEYGLTLQEKLTIGLGICTPLLKKIRADLHRNIDPAADETESVNRLNPQYSHGVSSPGRHVRTRLYFTSESHIHSLLTVLRYGGLLDETKDEQWRRAMEYVNAVTELNYMTQIVIMLYEDPTKDQQSEERFHVELHFSPGVVCCVQKNLPPGPGFRPQSRSGPRDKLSEKGVHGAASHECGEKPGCIEEEEDELTLEEEGKYDEVWSDHESPTILEDGNPKTHASPPETSVPVVPLFLSSQPIPIGKVLQCMAAGEAMEAPGEERLKLYPIMRCNSDSQRPRSLDSDAAEPPKVDKGRSLSSDDTLVHVRGFLSSSSSVQHCFVSGYLVRGQMSSYLRICSVADLSKVFGSSGSLFSTAVISGSSSAPDLKNLFPSAVADGLVSVPSIRPLETLHNALSLHQLDQFLGKVTSATYRLLLSSVPKGPAPFGSSQFSALPVASPSSSMIWSGPPSFVSSSGPSTPTSSTLDIWTRLRQMNENESSTAESSGTTSRNSYSTPPSPHDSRYYNSSL
ncbi:inositol hexakisphosphate and diphosphoinositol-pentakisphosphate kinase isoform X9 [Haemaphysalis longicornis]